METPTMVTHQTRTIDPSLVDAFASMIRGQVLSPGDPEYDDGRAVRNGMIDRRPALIVRASGTRDVVDAVTFAREQGLTLSIRGGAHNVAGNAVNDDGVVIDLSRMRAVHVDPAASELRAQGGATWGDLDRESQPYGMSVPGGVVSSTGIGGLTLHGGLGHLRRKYGLSIDNLLEVEIVIADGTVLTASQEQNADLFWAVRGAGSNFGVVTSMRFRMRPIGPMVFLCGVAYPQDEAGSLVRAWRDWVADTPDEVSSLALLWNVPDAEEFPPELRKQPVFLVAAIHCGSPEEAERATRPLRELAEPMLDLSHPELFTNIQSAFDPYFPSGRRYYWKSTYLDDFSDAATDVIAEAGLARPSNLSGVTLWHLGGAIGRVDPSATAYYRRDAPFLFTAEATWTDPDADDANIGWSRQALANMQPYSRGGAYLNFPGFGEEKDALLRATYGPNYGRLVALKTQYDPDNVFHMNQNIRPAGR
jgi:FAD/FMN-containing dehydrogenase